MVSSSDQQAVTQPISRFFDQVCCHFRLFHWDVLSVSLNFWYDYPCLDHLFELIRWQNHGRPFVAFGKRGTRAGSERDMRSNQRKCVSSCEWNDRNQNQHWSSEGQDRRWLSRNPVCRATCRGAPVPEAGASWYVDGDERLHQIRTTMPAIRTISWNDSLREGRRGWWGKLSDDQCVRSKEGFRRVCKFKVLELTQHIWYSRSHPDVQWWSTFMEEALNCPHPEITVTTQFPELYHSKTSSWSLWTIVSGFSASSAPETTSVVETLDSGIRHSDWDGFRST